MIRIRQIFTLVELLVVVAIISILAALLLPTLQQAINSATSASCMNQVKQLGLYMQLYADDFSGAYFMSRSVTGSNGARTYSYLVSKLYDLPSRDSNAGNNMFYCPNDSTSQKSRFVDGYISYGINSWWVSGRKNSSFKKPHNVVAILENLYYGGAGLSYPTKPSERGRYEVVCWTDPAQAGMATTYNHQFTSCNVVWLDGHASAVLPAPGTLTLYNKGSLGRSSNSSTANWSSDANTHNNAWDDGCQDRFRGVY